VPESVLPSQRMTCNDKSPTASAKSRRAPSSLTLPAASTSSAKGVEPYWNAACAAISSGLWLPTALPGSALSLSSGWCSKTVGRSWFSTNLLVPVQPQNSQKTCWPFWASSVPASSGSIATQSRKIRLYPTAPQRALLRHWLGTARFVYNRTLDFLKAWQGKRPSWMEIATDHILPALPDWAEAVPYQIKKMAINEACDAYTAAKRKYRRTGESRDYGPLA